MPRLYRVDRMKYVELTKANISQDVLDRFDCGHPDFNDFLATDAKECTESGNGVTYILIDEAEENVEITTIFAFAKAFQKIQTGNLGVGKNL